MQLNGTQLPLVKLCDFGFSKDKFDDSEPQTQIGTALFTAPEIFTNTQGQVGGEGTAWPPGAALGETGACCVVGSTGRGRCRDDMRLGTACGTRTPTCACMP